MMDQDKNVLNVIKDPEAQKELDQLVQKSNEEVQKIEEQNSEVILDVSDAEKAKEKVNKKLQSKLKKKMSKYLPTLKPGPVFYKGQEIKLLGQDFVVTGLGRKEISLELKNNPEQIELVNVIKGDKVEVNDCSFTIRGFSTHKRHVVLRVEDKHTTDIHIDYENSKKPQINKTE